MSERVVPCEAGDLCCMEDQDDLCCMEDQDDPCFQPFIGPPKRPVIVRYSARFTEQMRGLSGDHRWPLHLTAPAVSSHVATPKEDQ